MAQLRDLLTRHGLAIERHRALIARRLGLGETEVAAVVHLAQDGELTAGELRERLALSSGGATAVAQRLERDGHVVRRPHPHDGRSVVLSLAPRTRELLGEHVGPFIAAIDAAAAGLSAQERETVRRWLTRIVDVAEAESASPARCASRSDDLACSRSPTPGSDHDSARKRQDSSTG